MRALRKQISIVAPTDGRVLISGESGTGKELVARAIHAQSKRRNEPFVEINSAAIPEELVESELFGHSKGAFSGATRAKKGKFEIANGATIFLDEIGDMSPRVQAKMLRVLEEQRFEPVGSNTPLNVDVRVISATNKPLDSLIDNGNFRSDLFYRLNVIPFQVPPLRERSEDIPLLVEHFLRQISAEGSQERKVYAPEAVELLVASHWPGNIRQLYNVVRQNVALSPMRVISAEQVRSALGEQANALPSFSEARDEFTRNYLSQLLQITGGNVSQAARLAKRNRTDFYKLLGRHQLNAEQFKDGR